MACIPFFIGCFAENELGKLVINRFPSYLIVNIDASYMAGSHWLAICISNEKIEISFFRCLRLKRSSFSFDVGIVGMS